jgi:hypothetical protein
MGMLDSEIIFSAAQAVTATGDTASTNVYDSGGANGQGDMGQTGENLWFNATVNTAFTSGGAGTLQVVIQDSADNATFADVTTGPVFALAALTLGAVLLQIQPPPGMRRYSRLAYRGAVAVFTAGKVDGYVSNTIQRNVARNSGFTVA